MNETTNTAAIERVFKYLALLACLPAAIAAAGGAAAGQAPPQGGPAWQTISSLTEPSKYTGSFPHYAYVNPQAPKGGSLNRVIVGSFNSLNPYIIAGQVPAGLAPFGGGLLYETLMDQSLEEDGVSYPAIAAALQYPPDNSWVKFRLDPKARWHDGVPISADDVVWSFNILRRISPYYSSYYAQVEKAEKTAADAVKFTFKMSGNRELPKIMGDLAVLPRHWWEGVGKDGKKRDITKPGLEIPLGSGPYKIAAFEVGKYILWQRVPTAWAAVLPQNIGRNNYDSIKYSYMLDSNAEWEAFKKGGLSDYRLENSIARWENGYNFAAVRQGAVKKAAFPAYGGIYQAYYFNTRRAKFADKRVREALSLALDFASINKMLFFNKYQRTNSYYGRQIVAQDGVPQEPERRLLEEARRLFPAFVPPQLFSAEFVPPDYSAPGSGRKNLSAAMRLLRQAGWELRDNRLADKSGRPFTLEILLDSAAMERPAAFYRANLCKLGIEAAIRIVDASQYANRVNNFDFDMIMAATGQSSSPGNEQEDYFGSSSAGRPGSRNYAGIKNPAIDWLIAKLLAAPDRTAIVAAARAIDLVLLWNYYSVPNWRSPYLYLAYWDKFGRPATQPRHAGVDIFSWWVDKEKEKALVKAGYAASISAAP
ncbi:extracellular solute-binding protein [Candidatus Tokpelaia sp.]|uniref:extracellular solute-binding protein n=1 Tax=Candidatus Tokpelaia sp. TaxID=2233777 RepID=UPI00123BD51E|nr:extracellular solute-binding protein [Candidatus Tokpelaia sp.]KAA6405193.1 ABC transporter substrate-binding protein [Candidatus Tokpelaia sp.]